MNKFTIIINYDIRLKNLINMLDKQYKKELGWGNI